MVSGSKLISWNLINIISAIEKVAKALSRMYYFRLKEIRVITENILGFPKFLLDNLPNFAKYRYSNHTCSTIGTTQVTYLTCSTFGHV